MAHINFLKVKEFLKAFILPYFFILIFSSCGGGGLSDYKEMLPGGYEFISEGNVNRVIHGNNIVIPCTVENYTHNEEFILVHQKPVKDCFYPLDSKFEVIAPIQFWVINVKKKKLLGPLTLSDFIELRNKLKIPEDLKIKLEI